MSESRDEVVEGAIVEPSTEVAERPEQAPALPDGVQPSPNYVRAIELGRVLAKSGYYKDAREEAQAAVKVMVGMDLGISPTAAMQGIHTLDKSGRVSFIIESKLLGSIIRQRRGYDYKIVKRDGDGCTLRFMKDGEEVNVGEGLTGGEVSFTREDAERANLTKTSSSGEPSMHDKYPEEMLFWRCLAKGVRIHFPELLSGQPIYTEQEMGQDVQDLRDAIAPPGPQPVQTEKAEELRRRARGLKDRIDEVNPAAITGGRFGQMMRNAEHSEVQLENLCEVLTDNLTAEELLVELWAKIDELDEETMPESAKKALREKVGRIKGPAAKVEKIEEALAQVAPDNEGGDEDGESTRSSDAGE